MLSAASTRHTRVRSTHGILPATHRCERHFSENVVSRRRFGLRIHSDERGTVGDGCIITEVEVGLRNVPRVHVKGGGDDDIGSSSRCRARERRRCGYNVHRVAVGAGGVGVGCAGCYTGLERRAGQVLCSQACRESRRQDPLHRLGCGVNLCNRVVPCGCGV